MGDEKHVVSEPFKKYADARGRVLKKGDWVRHITDKTEPKQIAFIEESVCSRGHRVFFEGLTHKGWEFSYDLELVDG